MQQTNETGVEIPPKHGEKRMVQLDGLRALAVLSVMLEHLLWRHPFTEILPWGVMGVQLFFVLSGFLITRILLRCRELSETGVRSSGHVLKRFYIRRCLRIFPCFYGALLVLYVLDVPPVRETIGWHVSYLSNIYLGIRGSGHGHITHFWSLAVEEQFYMIWPWLILFIPRRALLPMVLVFILSAPVYRLATSFMEWNWQIRLFFPFAAFDSLGMGALLAFGWSYSEHRETIRKYVCRAGLWVGVPLLLACIVMRYTHTYPYGFEIIVSRFAMGMAFVWLVDRTAQGFKGPVGWVLSFKPLVWIGTLSYGIYVYHHFSPDLLQRVFAYFSLPYPWEKPWTQWIMLVCFSVSIAAISWYVMEKPINSLKDRFPYK